MIPQSHMDLLTDPIHAVFTTFMPDGQPQSSLIWVTSDGDYLYLSTALERQKGKNIQANPKVNVLVVDPTNNSRWLEVRGEVVDITPEGAIDLADALAQQYSDGRNKHFYGDVYTVEQQHKETRVTVKIKPVKINCDAIFS